MIHGDGPAAARVGDHDGVARGRALEQLVEPHADERRELLARQRRRRSRSPGTRPASPPAPPPRAAPRSFARAASFGSSASAASYAVNGACAAPLRLRRMLADQDLRARIGRIELQRPSAPAEGRVEIALPPRDISELAIQKRAVGRRGDRLLVEPARLVEPSGLRRLARGRDIVLQPADAQDLDAAAQRGRGSGRRRPPPRGS